MYRAIPPTDVLFHHRSHSGLSFSALCLIFHGPNFLLLDGSSTIQGEPPASKHWSYDPVQILLQTSTSTQLFHGHNISIMQLWQAYDRTLSFCLAGVEYHTPTSVSSLLIFVFTCSSRKTSRNRHHSAPTPRRNERSRAIARRTARSISLAREAMARAHFRAAAMSYVARMAQRNTAEPPSA